MLTEGCKCPQLTTTGLVQSTPLYLGRTGQIDANVTDWFNYLNNVKSFQGESKFLIES